MKKGASRETSLRSPDPEDDVSKDKDRSTVEGPVLGCSML
jgi:hypothetical protein